MSIKHFFANSAGCSRPFPGDTGRAADRGAWPAGTEPALNDVLADPLVQLVMRRDGVSLGAIRQLVAQARAGLGHGQCPCRAA